MGRHGAAAVPARAAALLLLPLLLLLLLVGGARAGLTSEYRRHLGAAIDMPLDADVFRPPPGYNAPEQVQTPSHHNPVTRVYGHHGCFYFYTVIRGPSAGTLLRTVFMLVSGGCGDVRQSPEPAGLRYTGVPCFLSAASFP
jgi:hypothetical protein